MLLRVAKTTSFRYILFAEKAKDGEFGRGFFCKENCSCVKTAARKIEFEVFAQPGISGINCGITKPVSWPRRESADGRSRHSRLRIRRWTKYPLRLCSSVSLWLF